MAHIKNWLLGAAIVAVLVGGYTFAVLLMLVGVARHCWPILALALIAYVMFKLV